MAHPTHRARRRPGENRARLIAAGIFEFARHGYHGTSTTAIASRADVPQPHVYTNFATKRELFLACLSAILSAESETLELSSRPLSKEASGATLELRDAAEPAQPGWSVDSADALLLQSIASVRDPVIGGSITELLREHHLFSTSSPQYRARLLRGAAALLSGE